MKKKDTKARMQIIFGALILALFFSVELYMMINYSEKYLIIAGIALIELIFLYVIIQGIFALKDEKEIRNEEQYDNVFKSEKASYLMLKKYFEEFEDKLNYLEKASKIPTEEIINAQKGIAKVIMNRNREGSEAMISTTEQITEQLTEVQKQSEALQSLLASCKDEIIVSQKAAGDSSEKSVQMQIQDLVVQMKDMELRLNTAISQNQKMIVQSAPVSYATAPEPVSEPAAASESVVAPEAIAEPEPVVAPEAIAEPEPVVAPEAIAEPEPVVAPKPIVEPEPVAAPEAIAEPEPVVAPEAIAEPEPVVAPKPIAEPEPVAASEPVVAPEAIAEPEPVVAPEAIVEPEPVAASEAIVEPEPVAAPEPIVESEPVAAPEAIVEPEPVAASEPVAEPVQPAAEPASDSNRSLSPDEIAALFANMGNDSASETKEEPVTEPEPEVTEEPIAAEATEAPADSTPPMPDLSDPNKTLSPDEIAALFANMGN